LGILKPSVDAHVLGITSVGGILEECGRDVVYATEEICMACDHPEDTHQLSVLIEWLRAERITRVGFSYRLGAEGVDLFERLIRQLERKSLFADQGGPVRALFFAGLPESCAMARDRVRRLHATFDGEETPYETLERLGLRPSEVPRESGHALRYDSDRLAFGEALIREGSYLTEPPVDRGGYEGFGTEKDTVAARLEHARRAGTLPLYRAHMGQYLPDHAEAVRLFMEWTKELAATEQLDVLSIGSSQLSQSRFGEDWGSAPDGGGVPLNSEQELRDAWRAARPMLVRNYSGTHDLVEMARINDKAIHNAWQAQSMWWFCKLDNRGPYSLTENLTQQIAALRWIAEAGKPFEPNVPHHFSFRGADDVTYVVSGYIAARVAKLAGVRLLIAQNMLNTPKHTWGVQDLAKSRALLRFLRTLEDRDFSVVLQTRAGLDYLSADPFRAKVQLAAVTALMDDIEPRDATSPQIIHVVSWTEATRFADPDVITESVKICRRALQQYRRLRAKGDIDDMADSQEVASRAEEIVRESQAVIAAIEHAIPDPWSAEGLELIFAAGFLPVPYLWECRSDYPFATDWQTKLLRGGVRLVGGTGVPLSSSVRLAKIRGNLSQIRQKRGLR
jgi:hypothetical protein